MAIGGAQSGGGLANLGALHPGVFATSLQDSRVFGQFLPHRIGVVEAASQDLYLGDLLVGESQPGTHIGGQVFLYRYVVGDVLQ